MGTGTRFSIRMSLLGGRAPGNCTAAANKTRGRVICLSREPIILSFMGRQRVDPITVSVIQHRLQAIVEEMGEAMLRTSYSQILNSSRDFSTAICDVDGRLVAQAEHVPIHVGALPWAVQSV